MKHFRRLLIVGTFLSTTSLAYAQETMTDKTQTPTFEYRILADDKVVKSPSQAALPSQSEEDALKKAFDDLNGESSSKSPKPSNASGNTSKSVAPAPIPAQAKAPTSDKELNKALDDLLSQPIAEKSSKATVSTIQPLPAPTSPSTPKPAAPASPAPAVVNPANSGSLESLLVKPVVKDMTQPAPAPKGSTTPAAAPSAAQIPVAKTAPTTVPAAVPAASQAPVVQQPVASKPIAETQPASPKPVEMKPATPQEPAVKQQAPTLKTEAPAPQAAPLTETPKPVEAKKEVEPAVSETKPAIEGTPAGQEATAPQTVTTEAEKPKTESAPVKHKKKKKKKNPNRPRPATKPENVPTPSESDMNQSGSVMPTTRIAIDKVVNSNQKALSKEAKKDQPKVEDVKVDHLPIPAATNPLEGNLFTPSEEPNNMQSGSMKEGAKEKPTAKAPKSAMEMSVSQPKEDKALAREEEKAFRAYESGQYEAAAELYSQALANHPDDESVLFGLGTVYHQMKDYNKAQHYYSEVLRQNPKHEGALNNLLAVLAEDDPDAAISQLDKLEASRPDDGSILAHKAIVYAKMGNEKLAVEYFRRAIGTDENNTSYVYNYAVFLDKSGHREAAREMYSRLLEMNADGHALPVPANQIHERLTFLSAK